MYCIIHYYYNIKFLHEMLLWEHCVCNCSFSLQFQQVIQLKLKASQIPSMEQYLTDAISVTLNILCSAIIVYFELLIKFDVALKKIL